MPIFMKLDGVDGSVTEAGGHVRVFNGADSLVLETPETESRDPPPTEDLSLNYTRIVWTYDDARFDELDLSANTITYIPPYASDDVIVDGNIITAENYDSAW